MKFINFDDIVRKNEKNYILIKTYLLLNIPAIALL